jgi:hypothetical protein
MDKQEMEHFLTKFTIDPRDQLRINQFIQEYGNNSCIDEIRFNRFKEISEKYTSDNEISNNDFFDFTGFNEDNEIEDEIERHIDKLKESIYIENNIFSNKYEDLKSLIRKKELFERPMNGSCSYHPDKDELKILIKNKRLSLEDKKFIFDFILVLEGGCAYYNLHNLNNVFEINKTLIELADKAEFSNNWSKIYKYSLKE